MSILHNLLLFCQIFNLIDCQNESLIVHLNSGIIEGRILVTPTGNRARTFQGIPYAKPPVKDLRFRRPDPDIFWNGTLQCKEYRDACPQTHFKYNKSSEDCLHVNVFAHEDCLHHQTEENLCPVLYFVHGGANEFLSPIALAAEQIVDNFVQRKLVFVNVGYRLGALGFWSTGTPEAIGNWALEDIVLAAEWIQREIRKFGGDPNRVTIWGYSSSATLISLLSVSRRTRGLFHQMMPMSAMSRGDFMLNNDVNVYWQLAERVNCTSGNLVDIMSLEIDGRSYNEKVIDCMRHNASVEELMRNYDQLRNYNPAAGDMDSKGVWPRNDGPYGFFPDSPVSMMNRRPPITTLLGTTRNELGPQKLTLSNATRETVIETCQSLVNSESGYTEKEQLINACISRYANHPDKLGIVTTGNFSFWTEQTVELRQDFSFFSHTFWEAWTLNGAGATVFLYSFDFEQTGRPSISVEHGHDLEYLVEPPKPDYDDRDLQITKIYHDLLLNFVVYGHPTPGNQVIDNSIDVHWPSFRRSINHNQYMSIDLPPKIKTAYHKSAVEFWDFTVREIQEHQPNYAFGRNEEMKKKRIVYDDINTSDDDDDEENENYGQVFHYMMIMTCLMSFLVSLLIIVLYCNRRNRRGYISIA